MNRIKRFTAGVIAAAMVLSLMPAFTITASAADEVTISTASGLRSFASRVNNGETSLNAKLTANIDLGGSVWTPIGNSSTRLFTGTFDGGGYKITGLYINAPGTLRQGLFGEVGKGGTVKNLGVGGSVSGGQNVGGVVGLNNGTVTNCYNTVTVLGVGDSGYVGDQVGGVVGWNEGTVTNCYNTGTVSGRKSVGGVVGYDAGSGSGTVTNCYNTGAVSGSQYVGSVAGSCYATVKNCYFLNGTASGGIGLGSGSAVSKSNNQFASGEVAWLLQDGQSAQSWGQTLLGSSKDGYPILTNDSSKKVLKITFKNYDGKNNDRINYTTNSGSISVPAAPQGYYWVMDGKEFTGTKVNLSGSDITVTAEKFPFAGGTGTAETPYEISNLEEFGAFRDYINAGRSDSDKHFKLTADIEMSARSWTPIGNDSINFTGIFDGDGHKITGLYINAPDGKYQGLFGWVGIGGTVENLSVSGEVTGYQFVGGVAGRNDGTVTNCNNTGKVTSNNQLAGGIVGRNGGTVTNCNNTGDVSGVNLCVGGVAGSNASTIENCSNTGAISGKSDVGGVVGWNDEGAATNVYNTGAVSGSQYVGGVVGYNFRGTATNVYNTGAVSGSQYVGGIVGTNYIKTVKNCYYLDNQTDPIGNGDNGIAINVEGKSEAEFASGEVARILQDLQPDGSGQVWGQTLAAEPKDKSPVLTSDENKKVVKVTFADINKIVYTNPNGTVEVPPTAAGSAWVYNGEEFNSNTPVKADMTVSTEAKTFNTAIQDEIVTGKGTGIYENDSASGFAVQITSNLNRASISKLSVNAKGKVYETKNMPVLTIDGSAGLLIGIIINGVEITAKNEVTFNIE